LRGLSHRPQFHLARGTPHRYPRPPRSDLLVMSAPPDKVDLFKSLKNEYAAPRQPRLVRPTPGSYLAIEGRGRPGDALFSAQVEALYGVAYTTRMRCKFSGGQDYA